MFSEEKLFVAVPPLDGGESSQMAVDIQAQQFAKLSIDKMVCTWLNFCHKDMPIKVTDSKDIVPCGRLPVVTELFLNGIALKLLFKKYLQTSTLMHFGTFYWIYMYGQFRGIAQKCLTVIIKQYN